MREDGGPIRVRVERERLGDLAHRGYRTQLDPPLVAAAHDRRDPGVLPREVLRGHRRRRAGPEDGDLDRVHQRQRSAVLGIAERDNALNERQADARVAGKVGVDLGGEVGVRGTGRREHAGLDVEAAAVHVKAEDAGTCGQPLAVELEGVMYGGVDKDGVAAIVNEHLLGDQPVERLKVAAEIWS